MKWSRFMSNEGCECQVNQIKLKKDNYWYPLVLHVAIGNHSQGGLEGFKMYYTEWHCTFCYVQWSLQAIQIKIMDLLLWLY